MKLAKKAFLIALTMLTMVFAMSAQTLRAVDDPRNTAPTAGTGGAPGGPTGLFTIYDGTTLRKGEFTFSAAYSNFDRDPGNADFVEVPVSFQIGLSDNLELFFNTDALRQIKVNSPRNLSGFYLPNSKLRIGASFVTPPAIIMAPRGAGATSFPGAVFRPQGAPFVQYPFVGGSLGNFGLLVAAGPLFGFGAGTSPTINVPTIGGNGADNFPGLGSIFGGILPGVVLATTNLNNCNIAGAPCQVPTVFSLAPAYLPDAPFINREYGESAFNTFTVGAKFRFTGPNNPIGVGLVGFYRFYADNADDFSGFNQLQRGASPGGNFGDFGLVMFADARLRKWINVSANLGYIYNSSVKGQFPSGEFTLLDRPDEVIAGIGVDFPVNKFFQPIMEFKTTQYVGGRTPNAFENSPIEGLIGARIFPTRWMSLGGWYRHHFNQQDQDSFEEANFQGTVNVAGTIGQTGSVIRTNINGTPNGFVTSNDPHGFGFQITVGRRNARQGPIVNVPPVVNSVTLSERRVTLPCAPNTRPRSGANCSDDMSVNVTTNATDQENDVLTYSYTVSGGRVVGTGANVSWDLTGVRPGTYTVTVGADDGCGICGPTKTETITVAECDCEPVCVTCPTVDVQAPGGETLPGETITFTANVSGGSGNATYKWRVSQGEIISGQDTSVITVRTTSDTRGEVRATVDVTDRDACQPCTPSDSDTAAVIGPKEPIVISEQGKGPADDVKAQIDAFYIALNNDPSASGFIVNYGTDREIAKRERDIEAAIKFRGYDRSRITLARGGNTGQGIITRYWLVPAGAVTPAP